MIVDKLQSLFGSSSEGTCPDCGGGTMVVRDGQYICDRCWTPMPDYDPDE